MVFNNFFDNPEFFDIFGVLAFIFITIYAIEALKTKKSLPKWANISLLIIGIIGLIIDFLIVKSNFF